MVDAADPPFNTVVVHETGHGKFQQEIISGRHHLIADEPQNASGLGSGPI
jgi:putative redox protein